MHKKMNIHDTTDRLITPGFCFAAAANFFLFLSFYALMPLLPFYLRDRFMADDSAVGLILSSYMVACILVRPVAGYLLDTFRRRPIYLIAYIGFALLFCGYIVAGSIALFVIVRLTHGLMFGTATVSGTTLVSQMVPKKRLGEGLGIYGLANTLSMCLGPLAALVAYRHLTFDSIFLIISIVAAGGTIMAFMVRIPPRQHFVRHRLSIRNFFIPEAISVGITQLLVFIPYGATVTYIAVYADEISIGQYAGWYFTVMALGLAISRPLSGRLVDNGKLLSLIGTALIAATLTFSLLASAKLLPVESRHVIFLTTAMLQGLTYGTLHPSFNTMFVHLAPEHHRGAATYMFLTSNDLGIGTGMIAGGFIGQFFGGLSEAYMFGALCSFIAWLLFITAVRRTYARKMQP